MMQNGSLSLSQHDALLLMTVGSKEHSAICYRDDGLCALFIYGESGSDIVDDVVAVAYEEGIVSIMFDVEEDLSFDVNLAAVAAAIGNGGTLRKSHPCTVSEQVDLLT